MSLLHAGHIYITFSTVTSYVTGGIDVVDTPKNAWSIVILGGLTTADIKTAMPRYECYLHVVHVPIFVKHAS